MAESIALNCDCMEYMRTLPDKAFDLAVVDPPYGGGCVADAYKGAVVGRFGGRFEKYYLSDSSQTVNVERERGLRGGAAEWHGRTGRFGGRFAGYHLGGTDGRDMGCEVPPTNMGADIRTWDIAPPPEYFDELARVSKNQIIWGGNYFDLPPTRCFLIWRKLTISENFSMAMCEYAWTSFNDNAKLFECAPQGTNGSKRFHPTQKPVALYEWIYKRYAEQGYKILDTHLGSGSSRIAAYNMGLDFVGCEIDKTYFALQEQRFEKHTAQHNLFLE